MTTVLFAGGGSAGHITPAVAVADALKAAHPDLRIVFTAADRSDETTLLRTHGYEYRTIPAGKFPRGLSLRLFSFPILSLLALVRSFRVLRELSPAAVFSKGGYVSAPVALAAWVRGIPVILHASDSVPSMSDRFIGRFAVKVCTTFSPARWPRSLQKKVTVTGAPVRAIIGAGSKDTGRRITGFSGKRPVLLVIGGSQGSVALNEAVKDHFDALLECAAIIHLTGVSKGIGKTHARYWSRPYVTEELPHLLALADLAVSRAGVGTLSECALLRKPVIVVPLEGVAHDHQRKNAEDLSDSGAAVFLPQANLSSLPSVVSSLALNAEKRGELGASLHRFFPADADRNVATVILDVLRSRGLES